MSERKKRIEWIDAVKGLGIILVILGHMTIPQMVRRFIFSFHMPLFFFVSGYLFKNNFSKTWCLRKCDSLLIPYALYGFLTIAVMHLFAKVPLDIMLGSFLRGNGVGVLWFLMCLFVVEIVGGGIIRVTGDDIGFLFAATIAAAVLGWIVPKVLHNGVMCIRTVPAALAFWLAGYVAKTCFAGRKISWPLRCVGVAAMVTVGAMFAVQRVDLASARYGNIFLFYGTALSLVGLMFLVFSSLDISIKPLTFLGLVSLELMCLHGIVPFFVGMAVGCKALARILSLSILILLAYAIHRWIPLLSGQAAVFGKMK